MDREKLVVLDDQHNMPNSIKTRDKVQNLHKKRGQD